MKPKLVAAVVAAVLVVGGGAFALTRFMAASDDEAIAFVPSDALAYGNVFIRQSNSQKMALDDLVQKLPGVESTDELIRRIVELLDEALAEDGFAYAEDVEPWLGDQMATFLAPGGTPEVPNFAVLVESKDDGAAQDFIEKSAENADVELEEATYEGQTYLTQTDAEDPMALGVVEGFVVGGTEAAFQQAVDAHAGEETLADAERFVTATDPLRDDWIGLFYLDTPALIEELTPEGAMPPGAEGLGFGGQQPQAGILYATSDSAVFETSGGTPEEGPLADAIAGAVEPGLVPELPGESWAAFGIPQLGDTIGGLFDFTTGLSGADPAQLEAMILGGTGLRLEEDILSWMGDAGVFAQGANVQALGGGLVVESDDPAATQRLVRLLDDMLTDMDVPTQPATRGDREGFSVQVPGAPAPIFVLGGDRLTVTYGEEATDAAAGGGSTLAESEAFSEAQEAVGDDFNVTFFLDVDGIVPLVDATIGFTPVAEQYQQDVKPWLDAATHVVYAAKRDGDSLVQKVLVGFE